MRLETVVGWRDVRSPGDVTYAERPTRDGSALYAPMALRDPFAIGLAQQMVEERQFFRSEETRMKEGGFRVTAGLLHSQSQYEELKKLRVLLSVCRCRRISRISFSVTRRTGCSH